MRSYSFVNLQSAFQNPPILVFETLSERPRQIELSRLNSFLACSRAKNKNFSIYLLKPLHRQKMKENVFVVKSSGPLLGRLPLLKHVCTRFCYFLSLSVCSWEEIEMKKFSKVGLYIRIFADFSLFLISLTSHLFP